MPSALFLLSSTRRNGNSERLARAAAAHLDCACRWEDLSQPLLPPFQDLRPAAPAALQGRLAELAAAIFAASDLILVAPVYWYALPVPAKLLLDHWSGWLDMAGMDFAPRMRGKRLWLVTSRADPDPGVPEAMELMLERTARWLQMDWAGALHGIGDAPGEIEADHAAMTRAAGFLRIRQQHATPLGANRNP